MVFLKLILIVMVYYQCILFLVPINIYIYTLGRPPPRIPVANEGLVWDPRSQKHNNPGSDWNPGQGDNPIYTLPETNIAPENGWLEYYFPIGDAYFQGLC